MGHRILPKTTIPPSNDDWCSDRFSLLRTHLAGLAAPDGSPLYDVIMRDRHEDRDGSDPDLIALPTSDIAELWLFAVEVDHGLSSADCAAIRAFRARGGGCMVTRDHQDMGASVLGLGDLGAAHFFQRRNRELDPDRWRVDDTGTPAISWPNYHSGRNGDPQEIRAEEPRPRTPLPGRRRGHSVAACPSTRGRGRRADRCSPRAGRRHRHQQG